MLTPILTATFIYLTSYTCGQVHEDEYGFHVPTAVAIKSPVLGWVMVAFSLSPHPPHTADRQGSQWCWLDNKLYILYAHKVFLSKTIPIWPYFCPFSFPEIIEKL